MSYLRPKRAEAIARLRKGKFWAATEEELSYVVFLIELGDSAERERSSASLNPLGSPLALGGNLTIANGLRSFLPQRNINFMKMAKFSVIGLWIDLISRALCDVIPCRNCRFKVQST
jgi:hypothetical protein